MNLTKRELFAAGAASLLVAAGGNIRIAQAQEEGGGGRRQVPHKRATTKILFKAPSGYPNAMAPAAEGVWVGEQKRRGNNTGTPPDATENVWLMDMNGKVLKTVVTPGRNTSGLAIGGGSLWSCALASGDQNGVYQTDMSGKLISHRQVPLGPKDGGGIHGAFWQDGKLWIFANRLNAIMRLDPVSWTPDYIMPVSGNFPRYHGMAWDNGTILIIVGNVTDSYKTGKFGFERYDAATGRLMEVIDFDPGSADPHSLAFYQGRLISCDAGIHPGWPVGDSPTWGSIFEVNIANA